MRRIRSVDLVPPGSLVRPVLPADNARYHVRFHDGTGWECDGAGPCGLAHGWDWSRSNTSNLQGEFEVVAEDLTDVECVALAGMHDHLVSAWVTSRTPPAKPWLVGVGVIVTHVSDAGEARVLYCSRLAGASDGVGAYSVPGGRLEPTDADVVACARREMLEEAGLVLADARVLPGHKLGRRPDGTPYITVFVHATVERGGSTTYVGGWPVAVTTEPDKHGPWSWFSATELHKLHDVSVEVGLPGVWDLDLALEVLASLAPARKRYEAFRGMIDRVAAGVTPRLERTSAERITPSDNVFIEQQHIDPRLWQRDPAGDNAMLCFADAAGERTWLRPGETCHRLVIAEVSRGS